MPCPGCEPPYSYKNQLPLNTNTSLFEVQPQPPPLPPSLVPECLWGTIPYLLLLCLNAYGVRSPTSFSCAWMPMGYDPLPSSLVPECLWGTIPYPCKECSLGRGRPCSESQRVMLLLVWAWMYVGYNPLPCTWMTVGGWPHSQGSKGVIPLLVWANSIFLHI